MFLVPLALLIGACVGLLAGGAVNQVVKARIAYPVVLLLAVLLSALVGSGIDLPAPGLVLIVALFGVGAACMLNLHIPGTGIVLIGLGLNVLVVVLNGHVPVDASAVVGAGVVDGDQLHLVNLGTGREFQTSDTLFPVLGAVVPLRPIGEVFSFGDLIVMAGLANVGFRLVRPVGYENLRRSQPPRGSRERQRVIDLTDSSVVSPPQIPPARVVTISGEADHPPQASP